MGRIGLSGFCGGGCKKDMRAVRVLRQLSPPIVAGRPADHLERASRERVSALEAAVQNAGVKGLVREMKDPAHDGSADRAIEQYWNGAGEQVLLDGGAQIEKNPDRQIAKWGAEFETAETRIPGTGRGADSRPALEKDVSDSPEREANLEKPNESIEIELDMGASRRRQDGLRGRVRPHTKLPTVDSAALREVKSGLGRDRAGAARSC